MPPESFEKPDWNAATARLGRRILRAALRDLLLLAALIVAGEAAVRTLAPGYARFVYSPSLTGGHPVTTNSFGLRDREFPAARPEGELRILCLGNSITFGSGVAEAETYPKQLERLLKEQNPRQSYLVINGGGEGQSTDRAMDFLRRQAAVFDPALVVLGFSPSMLGKIAQQAAGAGAPQGASEEGLDPRRGAPRTLLRRLCLSSYLYVFVDTNLRDTLYRWNLIRDRLDVSLGAVFAYAFDAPGVRIDRVEEAYSHLHAGLVRIKGLLDDHRVPFVVLLIPPRFRLNSTAMDNDRGFEVRRIRIDPLERVAAYAMELGIPVVDVTPALSAARRAMLAGELAWDDLYLPLDYSHLTPAGLEIVARELLRAIDAHGWLKSAVVSDGGGMDNMNGPQ